MAHAEQHPNRDSQRNSFPTEWSFDYWDHEDPSNPMSPLEGARQETQNPMGFGVHNEDWAPGPPVGSFFG